MTKHAFYSITMLFLLTIFGQLSFAQGPPITSDKPIMLGAKRVVIKTLTEVRKAEESTLFRMPLMLHYLPTNNTLIGLYIPFVSYDFGKNSSLKNGQTLGDIEVLAKYQFYRKDKTGKTLRMVAKTLQTLPTGKKLDIEGMSTGLYQNYMGLVLGYESIKYGVSNELGYNMVFGGNFDELRYKLGFGLPLLKPVYPVKQINLYFEYQSSWFVQNNDYALFYAQGIQYAKGRLTLEMSIQFPLIQYLPIEKQRKFSTFFGTRYVF
ncbi:MAG: hypothetical protein ACPG5B_10415 [Chitinophagales bacterium]